MPFRLIMDNVPSPIFVKDDKFRIVYANKAFLDVYSPDRRANIVGTTTIGPSPDAESNSFLGEDRRALELGQSEMVEEIDTYTGQKRIFLTRRIAFTTPSGEKRLLGICNDITELHEREKSLAAANVFLQSFSALAAHDLRTPLSSIVDALDLIRRDEDSILSERSAYYVGIIAETACSLSDNIECLLVANKVDKQGNGIRLAACDLNLALAEVKFRLSSLIARHNVLIYAGRLPTINAEATLMRQLFQNLIENSIKYRQINRQLTVTIRYEEQDREHFFELEDSGRGMPKDVATRAFDLYEQEHAHRNEGAGLGLALCKRIIEMHRGSIQIDPNCINGCRVTWTLPLTQPEAEIALSA